MGENLPVFSHWRAFQKFEREVSNNRRYIRTETTEAFLNAVRNTCRDRSSNIKSGRTFWRAQSGHDYREHEDIGMLPAAFGSERMKPLTDKASEGRANSKGIPVLYLCTSRDAAMSEVRPWLGTYISVARFQTNRNLRVVDCTNDISPKYFIFEEPPEDQIDEIVWSEINRAFTKPVTRTDDTGEYVATQILAELMRDEGFDGIAYRSAFGQTSANLALFDLDCADVVTGHLFEATSINFNFRERDNPYFVNRSKNTTSRTTRRKTKRK